MVLTSERDSRTLADQVLARLQDDIIRGVYPPGTKIRESDLAGRYGVSRGPLREAIRRLESRRLIEHVPHIGARVASLSVESAAEFYKVREALEGMAARLAATEATDEEIAHMRSLVDSQETCDDLGRMRAEGDLNFHDQVVRCSRNETLADLLAGGVNHLVRMYRYRFSAQGDRPQRVLDEHRCVLEAIELRDGELAEMLMRRHIALAWENIRRTVVASQQPESPPENGRPHPEPGT